ncbi:hypothetical protein [Pseudomonas aeruginosa]|uniref:hypothetical protein n=1 Tax=Pseudomonas aeruginosa TaxID=287 RepID=UPI0021AFABD3|nr:hypothetical protein [Pseudomonas aeruginosa]
MPLARKKNYKAEMQSVTKGLEAVEDGLVILLPKNPRKVGKIDHAQYMGVGFDAWAVQSAHVIRALLNSGNFSIATLIGYSSNGLRYFLAFLKGGALDSPPSVPNSLEKRHLERFVSWLKLKYPNGATAKNCYTAFKSLVISLIEYSFIEASQDDLLPDIPFPNNAKTIVDTKPLTLAEMQRLISALKVDLISIHKGTFVGNAAEAMTALFLITAARSGINTTPLLEMTRDALQPHPFIPNLRILTTVKRRGKGAQSKTIRQTEIHDEYSAIPLDGVAVVNKALAISAPLVELAPEELKSHIWLYRSGQPGREHIIVSLSAGSVFQSTKSICERHSLKDDKGESLVVNLMRLRKTMESRLWKLSGGDLLEVSAVMGHSPGVADNHYLKINDEIKTEGAIFVGEAFPDQLRGLNVTPTPPGGCKDSLYGSLAPKDGVTHCSEFIHCLTCPSYAIVGTLEDLYRLFSYQQFLHAEIEYFLTDEWEAWRQRQSSIIALIDDFTSRKFSQALIGEARAKAEESPHPFWSSKIKLMKKIRGGSLVG